MNNIIIAVIVIAVAVAAWVLFRRYFSKTSPSVMGGGYDSNMQEKMNETTVAAETPSEEPRP